MEITLPLHDYIVISLCICFSYLYLLYRAILDTSNKTLVICEGLKIFGLLLAVLGTVYILFYS